MRGRPLPGCMDQDQNPYRIFNDLIDEAIAAMWGQFAGACNLPHVAKQGKVGELGDGIAEQLVHSHGSGRVAGFEIVPDRRAVLLGFRRPEDFHA
jgi:hypothetical protein